MAILCALIAGLAVVLLTVLVVLHLDARGRDRARLSWQRGMEAKVAAQGVALSNLARVIASDDVDIGGTKATRVKPPRPSLPAITPPPPSGPPVVARGAGGPLPSFSDVDMTGDRSADNGPETPPSTAPGDDGRRTSSAPPPPVEVFDSEPPTSDGASAIRARFEAEEQARHPNDGDPGDDEETERDRTLVVQRRPSLVGAPLERPKSDPHRTAQAFAASHQGTERATPSVTAASMSLPPHVRARWLELLAAENVNHCHSDACAGGRFGTDSCACTCDGCDRIAVLLARAVRETIGAGR